MKREWIAKLWILLVIGLISMVAVSAVPTGSDGTITPISSSRFGTQAAKSTTAYAGNVTEFNLNATSITQTWQGYFGNITGRIVLGNSANQSMYDWTLASPNGEIYASRALLPTWSSIACANTANQTAEDVTLGSTGKADAVVNTFTAASHTGFYVGSVQIVTNTCNTTKPYVNTGVSGAFEEVLLSDGTNLVYTALLEQNVLGFDGRTHDFEMLVGEDGHDGNVAPTTYYFFLELE